MSRFKTIRMLSVLMVVLVAAAAVPLPAGATRVFTDVKEGDWFNSYVLKAYEAGLISGYEDATFKPNEPINKIAVIITLAKLAGMKVNDPAVVIYRAKYNATMDADRIPAWAKDYIAYALEKGIVTEEELATFVKSDGSYTNAKRYEVAVYFARALGLEQEARSMSNVILSFKDNELISSWSRGYIKVLVDRNIISGDTEGRFNPNNEITRAAIAKMLATSLDFVDIPGNTADDGITEVEGQIEEVVRGTGRTIIKISTSDGDTDIYDVGDNATVKLDGAAATLTGVVAGQQGTFGIKDNKIVSIDVTSKVETVEGILKSVFNGTEYGIITVEKDDDEKVTFRVPANAAIKLDGAAVTLDRLNSGDRVKVTASNTYATGIEAETKTKTAMGIFGGFKTEKNLILILKKGSQEIEYPVDDSAEVERDGKDRDLDDLRKGDEIEITTEYGIVTKIVAESVDRQVEGTIYSLLIARPHQLTIINEDGDTETFMVPVDVSVEIDGKTASIYDLRLDYRAEVQVESDEAVSIEATSVVSQNELVGTVEYVNTSVNVITIKVLDVNTNAYIMKQVNVNDDTRIIDKDGDRRYLRHISAGDRLIVVGHSELGVFIADTIMITNR